MIFFRSVIPSFHYSIVPPFHRSTIPPFHRSSISSLPNLKSFDFVQWKGRHSACNGLSLMETSLANETSSSVFTKSDFVSFCFSASSTWFRLLSQSDEVRVLSYQCSVHDLTHGDLVSCAGTLLRVGESFKR